MSSLKAFIPSLSPNDGAAGRDPYMSGKRRLFARVCLKRKAGAPEKASKRHPAP